MTTHCPYCRESNMLTITALEVCRNASCRANYHPPHDDEATDEPEVLDDEEDTELYDLG